MREIALSALLHDIGKFAQRARLPSASSTSPEGKNHSDYSESFVNENDMLFTNAKIIAKLCASHHCAKEKNDKIIQLADWLSSTEREEVADSGTSSSLNDPQICIFSRLRNDNTQAEQQESEELYHSLLPLIVGWKDDRQTLMGYPTKKPNIGSDYYKSMWNNFIEEVKRIKKKDDLETIYYLLQKYCSFIPSATRWGKKGSQPDISLFDHLKTTCAIACSLDAENIPESEYNEMLDMIRTKKENNLAKEHFLIISGDISGIQHFIYQISSKGAAKALKGRSMYIQLLTEITARYIVDELGLTLANILFCGGGHFYILAARKHEDRLGELKKKVNEILLKVHNGELYLAIEWIGLGISDFYSDGLIRKWSQLGEKLNNAKKRKFSELLDLNSKEVYNNIFGPYEEGGVKHTCDSCGAESATFWYKDDETNTWKTDWVENENMFCDFCKSMIELTEKVKESDYLQIIRTNETKANLTGYQDIFNNLGYLVNLEKQETLKNDGISLKLYKGSYIEYTKSESKDFHYLIPLECKNTNSSFGFKFVPIVFPLKNGRVKSLDDVAKEAKGTSHLGIARMDVDNLGKIFSKGLGDYKTISRISTLSRMFSLFFEGYVPYIINRYYYNNYNNSNSTDKNEKEGNAYLVYSGGDDVFVIGPWNEIIEILDEINHQFREFTGRRKNVTISAGMAMVPAKYPIYKGAELAKEALEKSKKSGKNRICIFDNAFEWDIDDCEYEKVKQLRDTIIDTVKRTTKGLLNKLSSLYYILSPEELEEGRIDIQRVWVLHYYINRYIKKYPDVKQNLNKIKESYDKMIQIQPRDKNRAQFMIIPVAIKWAELLTREKKE